MTSYSQTAVQTHTITAQYICKCDDTALFTFMIVWTHQLGYTVVITRLQVAESCRTSTTLKRSTNRSVLLNALAGNKEYA